MTGPVGVDVDVFAAGWQTAMFHGSVAVHADCFNYLARLPDESVHAVVTDPPYGVREFDPDELARRAAGAGGGVWRQPPSFDGWTRSPLPRFTALTGREREQLREFFQVWSSAVCRVLRPGGHVMVAANAFLSLVVFGGIVDGGLEFRGEIVRLVSTLRGGDRPKGAENEFGGVVSLPRGGFEPWGVFRKPLPRGMTVAGALREYGTGGLRRLPGGAPFTDVIVGAGRTSKLERDIGRHPSVKPQVLMRRLVWAALPLGVGVVVDPFMGSGSTLAAAEAVGVSAVGVERDGGFFGRAVDAVPRLAELDVGQWWT